MNTDPIADFLTRIRNASSAGLKIVEIPVNHRNRLAGETQVYSLKKIPKIVVTHLLGLYKLNRELKNK